MAKIIISNVEQLDMNSHGSSWSYGYCYQNAMMSARLCWLANDNDIVILSKKPTKEMIDYIIRLKGNDLGKVNFLSPFDQNDFPLPLSLEHIKSDVFISKVKKLLQKQKKWELFTYFNGPSNLDLQALWHVDNIFSSIITQADEELFSNRKTFRSMAYRMGISVAEGYSVKNHYTLRKRITTLMSVTGAVIIKQECHSFVDNNIILTISSDISTLSESKIVYITNPEQYESLAENIWLNFKSPLKTSLIIEVYHQPVKTITAEYKIERNRIKFLNLAEHRTSENTHGFIIPPSLPPYQLATFMSGAAQLARSAHDIGYIGRIGISGGITEEGDIIFNEFNTSINDASLLHDLCEEIICRDYGKYYCVITNNKIKVNISFLELLNKLEENNLSFDFQKKSGIIICAENVDKMGATEFLFVGNNRDESALLEDKLNNLLQLLE